MYSNAAVLEASEPRLPNRIYPGASVLRVALAGLVIFSHSWILSGGLSSTDPLSRFSAGRISFGELAVDSFFALSGMLVYASRQRLDGWRDYLFRRAVRIYPGFIVAVLIQAYLFVPLSSRSLASVGDWGDLAGRLQFLLTLGGAGDILPRGVAVFSENPFAGHLNGSLWTIRYEFLCYLLLLPRFNRWFLSASTTLGIAWAASIIAYGFSPDLDWGEGLKALLGTFYYWPRFLSFFLGGCFIASLPTLPSRGMLVTALAGVAASLWLPVSAFRIFLAPAVTLLTLQLASLSVIRPRENRSPMDVSYGMYLYGFPLQQGVIQWCGAGIGPLATALISLPAAYLFGVLSWKTVEERALRLRNKYQAQRH